MSAYDTQTEGDYYTSKPIQPIQLSYRAFGGDTCVTKVAKYLTRKKEPWPKQIAKATHCFAIFKEEIRHSPVPRHPTTEQVDLVREFISHEPEEVRVMLSFILNAFYIYSAEFPSKPSHDFDLQLSNAFLCLAEYYKDK